MSQENVEIVAKGLERFGATGEFAAEDVHADFVWDMSKYEGWLERQTYPGVEGAREFLTEWMSAWEDWQLEVKDVVDGGDKVVAIMHQRGRSKATGVEVAMEFAQVWSLRDGKQTRMEMYRQVSQALNAVGLAG